MLMRKKPTQTLLKLYEAPTLETPYLSLSSVKIFVIYIKNAVSV